MFPNEAEEEDMEVGYMYNSGFNAFIVKDMIEMKL